MKIKLFGLGLSFLILSSCVSESDYKKLEGEKEDIERRLKETEQELSNLTYEYNLLIEEKRQAEIERNRIPYISEEQALRYIKDNYAFYDKDIKYRNVQLRRIADNSFKVSLEECTKKGPFSSDDFFWSSIVRTLTVYNNGKYNLKYDL